jgi:Ca2+-binding EF-hand superfamily protein
MAAERWKHALFLVLALLVLVADFDAQGRRPRRAGRGGRGGGSASQFNGFGPLEPPGGAPPLPGGKAKGKKPKSKKPAGPAPKAPAAKKTPPAKPEPPKPPDPMLAADDVTAAADRERLLEENRARLLREHYKLCDLDENGWISLREAQFTLGLLRADYQRMDANQDGRLDAAEFDANRELILARLGTRVPEPEPSPSPPETPPATLETPAALQPALEPAPTEPTPAPSSPPLRFPPQRLVEHFDADGTNGLDAAETARLLSEAGLALSSAQVLESMDHDDSGQLEENELFVLAWLVSKEDGLSVRIAPAAPPTPAPVAAESPDETPPATSEPRKGPSHFQRLDADRDGFLTEADLRLLQGATRLELRLRALLSALDSDGDGRLSAAEFEASMGGRAR